MNRSNGADDGVDVHSASRARAYDYLLGGSHNFAVDREMAHRSLELMPDVAVQAQANRAFLHRAVRYLVGQGVRQFLDLGCGVPTVANVHEMAHRADPRTRVAYVDIDATAIARTREVLDGNPNAVAVEWDLRDVEGVLGNPQVRSVLDLDQPVGLLLVAVLYAVSDADDPDSILARYRAALAPGSHLVLSHPAGDERPDWARVQRLSVGGPNPVALRSVADVARFFTGYELVSPGLVWGPAWRPDEPDDAVHDAGSCLLVGVGRLVDSEELGSDRG